VCRTRYFTDSGIIGTKEFVSENYQRFKEVFMSKREKILRRVVGLGGAGWSLFIETAGGVILKVEFEIGKAELQVIN
jgi:hypothetical protein